MTKDNARAAAEIAERYRDALIERIGTVADLMVESPLPGELGDVAYDLLRSAAAQLSSDSLRIASLRTDAQTKEGEAIQAETYRQMHDIAVNDLGYESILEALEAAPHASRPSQGEGIAEALKEAAETAYRICAESRHVMLGDKVSTAILAALRQSRGEG